MKQAVTSSIAKFIRRATLAVACAACLIGAAHGQSGPGSNTSSAGRSVKPLTNADVISLLAKGKQEQAILDRIRNHPATFDVSNQARASFDRQCTGIKHPGVSAGAWATEVKHVWDTMVNVVICQQTNGRGGEGACDLTPLQSSPKKTSAGPTPTPSKVPGRSEYEAITLQRGVTQDPGFANWANSGQAPGTGSPSTVQNTSFGQAPVSPAGVAKLPPTRTSPQRDAAPLADAATKAKTKLKLEAQFAAARRSAPAAKIASTPAPDAPEIRSLRQQKIFLTSFHAQAANMRTQSPPPAPANSTLLTEGNKPLMQEAPSSSAQQPLMKTPTAATARATVLTTPPAQPSMKQAPSSSVQYQSPSAPISKYAKLSSNQTICLTPQIYAVNGFNSAANASNPVIFTQDPTSNDYIISGCGFGNQGGQVYLSGAVTGGRINMVVVPGGWSPTQIEAQVQPGLTGVLDGWPDLIVAPTGSGTPAKFPNCRFYAQRKSVLLLGIPPQYAHLANVQVGDSTHGRGTMYCPGGRPDWAQQTPCIDYNASGQPLDDICLGCQNSQSQVVTNSVDRDGGQLQFDGGEDVYDLSYMAPGFSVDYFDAYWYWFSAYTCEVWQGEPQKAGDSIDFDPPHGPLNWYVKTSTEIAVRWSPDHCAWRWLKIFRVDDEYNSGYSLQVYVKGPIGVDPWTGRPIVNFGAKPALLNPALKKQ